MLLCFLVLFLLAFLSMTYDSDRGLGELDFALVEFASETGVDVDGAFFATDFFAVVLSEDRLSLYDYEDGRTNELGSFSDVQATLNSRDFASGEIFVVYEEERSPFLGDLLRGLAVLEARVGIAKVIER